MALVLSLLAAEFAVRQLGLLDRVSPFPRQLFRVGDAPDLPYRLSPGADVRLGEVRVRVNRFGLRGEEIDRVPAEGVRRWLVLGDSVAYGHLLAESDSLPVLLERELRRRGEPVEVLNGAAPGFNTSTELAFLREVGLGLSPAGVLLAVSLNDFAPAPTLSSLGFLVDAPAEAEAGPGWLEERSELYAVLRWAVRHLRTRGLRGSDAESDAAAWAALDRAVAIRHKRFYADPSGPGWQSVRRSLREMRDLLAQREIALVVAIFPEMDQVGGEALNLDPQARWRGLCEELALQCLDLWPAFADAATRAGEPLFLDTQHPSARGLAIAATVLAETAAF
jgi:lysophospholipase L1-like esterase